MQQQQLINALSAVVGAQRTMLAPLRAAADAPGAAGGAALCVAAMRDGLDMLAADPRLPTDLKTAARFYGAEATRFTEGEPVLGWRLQAALAAHPLTRPPPSLPPSLPHLAD